MTPFELFQQDIDEVIMLINYYIEKDDNAETTPKRNAYGGKREERIRVNDKTATGGWW